jgi:FkbM family methyltransferase
MSRIKNFISRLQILRSLVFPPRTQVNDFIKLTNGEKRLWMYLREDSYMEKLFLRHGLYGDWEKESLKIWAELSKISNSIIDIGANSGVFSLIAKSQNPRAEVIAIEPVPLNFEILWKNIKKNKFRIHAEPVALSDKEGVAKMFMLKDRLNYMTSVNDNRYEKHPEIAQGHEVLEIEVPIKPFKFLESKYHLSNVDLIKIDVEGHELEVLTSMLPVIRRDLPTILVEVIGDDNAIGLNRLFAELNYKYISIDEERTSVVVDRLWDNDHHNFLVCKPEVVEVLKKQKLVV